MSGPLAPRPGILDIAPYVPGSSKLPGRAEVLKLSSNEGALGPSPKAMEAYARLAPELHRYPDGDCGALRTALARRHGLEAARIICGAGSDELISLLARAYAGPGDEVLYSAHGFVMYPLAAMAVGATCVTAPEVNLTANVDNLLAKVSERTRIVFLANPNNPTGTYIPADEVARLRAALRDDVLLVVDSAYAEYVTRNDYDAGVGLVESHDNVVMLRTFSKIYALGGLRIGWGYGPGAVIDVLNRIRGPFNVSSAAQAAAIAALDDTEFVAVSRDHNATWLPWLAARLAALGLEVSDSVANFVLVRFPDEKGRDAAAAMRFFQERGIIPRDVASAGLPGYVRITIGREHEMRAVAEAAAAFMAAR